MRKLTVLDNRREVVEPGDTFPDFRGEVWTLVDATRPTEFGKAGKVYVRDEEGHTAELYASCFQFTVQAA